MSILYLVYRRLRPSLGIPFGFILMYGMYTGTVTPVLLMAATGFFLMHLFGDTYNDYCDYEEDRLNKRDDKLITRGVLTRKDVKIVSIVLFVLALCILFFTNMYVFILGIFYALVLTAYSYPTIRLKGKIRGYLVFSSAFLFFPLALATLGDFQMKVVLLFTGFFFFQVMYILCQKDSTDLKDRINIYKKHGWKQATGMAAGFAMLSSVFLFFISLSSPFLVLVWGANLLLKVFNLLKISSKTITRETRSNFILGEFLTPFVFSVVILL